MTKYENFSGQQTPSIVDTEYYRCNFSQPQPVPYRDGLLYGLRIFPGDDTPRTFIECNLSNCEFPPGSNIISCNTAVVSRNQVLESEDVDVDGRPITRPTREGDVFVGYYDENGNLIRPPFAGRNGRN